MSIFPLFTPFRFANVFPFATLPAFNLLLMYHIKSWKIITLYLVINCPEMSEIIEVIRSIDQIFTKASHHTCSNYNDFFYVWHESRVQNIMKCHRLKWPFVFKRGEDDVDMIYDIIIIKYNRTATSLVVEHMILKIIVYIKTDTNVNPII